MAAGDQEKYTYINRVAPGMKNVNIQFIVLDIGQARRTKDGQDVRTVRVADSTASVDVAVWNEIGECLKSGDICRLRNGYTNIRKGCLIVTCGKLGELQKVGELMMVFSEVPNMSEFNQNLLQKEEGGGGGSQKRSPPSDDEAEGNDGSGPGSNGNGPAKMSRSSQQGSRGPPPAGSLPPGSSGQHATFADSRNGADQNRNFGRFRGRGRGSHTPQGRQAEYKMHDNNNKTQNSTETHGNRESRGNRDTAEMQQQQPSALLQSGPLFPARGEGWHKMYSSSEHSALGSMC